MGRKPPRASFSVEKAVQTRFSLLLTLAKRINTDPMLQVEGSEWVVYGPPIRFWLPILHKGRRRLQRIRSLFLFRIITSANPEAKLPCSLLSPVIDGGFIGHCPEIAGNYQLLRALLAGYSYSPIPPPSRLEPDSHGTPNPLALSRQ